MFGRWRGEKQRLPWKQAGGSPGQRSIPRLSMRCGVLAVAISLIAIHVAKILVK